MICHSKDKQQHFFQKWCNDNGILIYPIPLEIRGEYNICVERKGKAEKGEQIFKNEPQIFKEDPSKNKLSVWDQIKLLYKIIYERECLTK